LALVLIVALQVSVCLCDIPEPDKELVEKYEGLKAVFTKRIVNALAKAQAALTPLMEGSSTGDKAKEYAEELQ
ncbi:hypothetical protein T01_11863, partial [Trichinella spiralis]